MGSIFQALIFKVAYLFSDKDDWIRPYKNMGLKIGENYRIFSINFGAEPYLKER